MEEKIPTMVLRFLEQRRNSHARIAKISGVGRPYVSMALSGQRPISDKLAAAIMTFLTECVLNAEVALAWVLATHDSQINNKVKNKVVGHDKKKTS